MRRINTIRLAYYSTVADFWLRVSRLSAAIAKDQLQRHDRLLLAELKYPASR